MGGLGLENDLAGGWYLAVCPKYSGLFDLDGLVGLAGDATADEDSWTGGRDVTTPLWSLDSISYELWSFLTS